MNVNLAANCHLAEFSLNEGVVGGHENSTNGDEDHAHGAHARHLLFVKLHHGWITGFR